MYRTRKQVNAFLLFRGIVLAVTFVEPMEHQVRIVARQVENKLTIMYAI